MKAEKGRHSMYCEYCGRQISDSVNYCPYCGAKQSTATASVQTYTASSDITYNLILVSAGTCKKSVAGDLLEDIFGYTSSQADSLIDNMPVMIAQNLTEEEAVYTAQVFSEYGMEVSLRDESDNYADLSSKAVSTVFDSDGSLLAKAAAVIGALTIANRVTAYRRYSKPSLLERIFKPLFAPKPVKHYRRFRPKQHKPEPPKRPEPRRIGTMTQPYRNTAERKQKPVTGHGGGPGGRMKGRTPDTKPDKHQDRRTERKQAGKPVKW